MVHCSETTAQRRGAAPFPEPQPSGCGPSRGIRHPHSVRSLKAAAQQCWFSVRSLKAAAQLLWFSVRSLKAAAQQCWFSVRSLKAAAQFCGSKRTALDNHRPLLIVASDVCDCIVQRLTIAEQLRMVSSRPCSALQAYRSQSVRALAVDDVHQPRKLVSRDVGHEMTVYGRYGGYNETLIGSEQVSQDISDHLESLGVEPNRLSGELILGPLMQFLIITAECFLRTKRTITTCVTRQPCSVCSPGDEVTFKHGSCPSSSVYRAGACSRSVRSLKAAAQLRLHSDVALEPGPSGSGLSRGIRHSRSVRSLKAAAQVRGASIEKHSAFE